MRVLLGLLLLVSAAAIHAQSAEPAATPASPASVPAPGRPVPTLPPLPDVQKTAFKDLQQAAMPLTPEQIRTLHREADAADRAASELPRFTPKPVSSSLIASLSPGSTPPVVRLFPNYVSNVMFIDEVGNPLLIDSVDRPGGDAFNVTWSGDPKKRTNGVTISTTMMYAMGNIAVHLEGVSVPVSVMLVSGQREVDTQVGIRVAGVGVSHGADHLPGASDAGLQLFLDGMPPANAKALTSSLPDVQVWELNGHFVVRTDSGRKLASPAWLDHKSSPDGTTVYVIPPVSPIVMLTDGDTQNLTVTGY